MSLYFYDFSRIRFSEATGETLVRRQKVRMEFLTGHDTGEEIVLRVDESRLSLEGPSVEEVIAAPGSYAGQTKVCSTRWSDGTGPGFELIWFATESTVDNVRVYANYPGLGSWRKRQYGLSPLVTSTDIRGMGSVETSKFQRLCDKHFASTGGGQEGQGKALQFDPGTTLVLDDTININPSEHAADCGIFGLRNRPTISPFAPRILWRGAAGKPVFAISTRGFKFGGLMIFPDTGYTASSLIDFQFVNVSPVGSAMTIRNCWLGGISGDQHVEYCLSTNLFGPGGSIENLEDVIVENTTFFAEESCVNLYKGQPYHWVLRDCFFGSRNGPSATCGRGIWIQVPQCSVSLENPAFGQLSMALAIDVDAMVSVTGATDIEKVKCLIGRGDGSFGVGGGAGIGAPISWVGGRFAQDSYSLASTNPTIAANNHTYVYIPLGNSTLNLTGCHFDSAGAYLADFRIISVSSVTAANCAFPNERPIEVYPQATRPSRLYTPGSQGRRASAGPGGETFDDLKYYTGTVSPSQGSVVIADAATFADVSWTQAELHPPMVTADIHTESGAPAAGAFTYTVSNRTTTGFRVTLGAAPGAGTSVRVLWEISPRSPT